MSRAWSHYLWLLITISAVALLVYFTPRQIEVHIPPATPDQKETVWSASYSANRTPDSFSFYANGSNHAKEYTGFSTTSRAFPQYNAEMGLMDHP